MQDVNGFDGTIEFVLRNADRIAQCIVASKEQREGQESNNRDENTGGGRTGHISDPTAMMAIKRVEPVQFIYCPFGPAINGKRDARYIRLPEKWLQVERITREYYTRETEHEKVRGVYQRRYLQGEYGERWERTCVQLNISRGFYYSVVHDVVRFAGLYAAGMGLISPYSRF